MANKNPASLGHGPVLTEWLTDKIDELAGLTGNRPLVFEDLHQAPVPPGLIEVIGPKPERSIDLRAVTTCVTHGRPYEMPMATNIFAFDPDEWVRLFPGRVMDYLITESGKVKTDHRRQDGKIPLPPWEKIPVVVATRMSLSFPGLFTAVPLHAVDFNDPKPPQGQRKLKSVWFTDGGVTSNFPIHRFDGLLPRWPTLGINLMYTGEDGKPSRPGVEESLIHLAQRRDDGILPVRQELASGFKPIKALAGFAGLIFRSAQTWHDNAYLSLPTYRDRSVEIWLKPEEGGLNLQMDPNDVMRLADRGSEAGMLIRDRFLNDPGMMGWTGHRWVRYRSAMASLMRYLRTFERAERTHLEETPDIAAMIMDLDLQLSYKLDKYSCGGDPKCLAGANCQCDIRIPQMQAVSDITNAIIDSVRSAADVGFDRGNCERRPKSVAPGGWSMVGLKT